MAEGLLDSISQNDRPEDRRFYGMTSAQVITNCDETFMGRVKVRFPWLPGYEPWVRVVTPMSGSKRGMFFIPQEGEEVLVAFNHGYLNEPYIVGSLWNGHDKPKEELAKDPIHQRAICTPENHEIVFDDAAKTIKIKSANGQFVVLGSDKIEIALDEQKTTAITLEKGGKLTIKASDTITLDAPTIDIVGGDLVSIHTRPSAKLGKRIEIYGSDDCSIDSTEIHIG